MAGSILPKLFLDMLCVYATVFHVCPKMYTTIR